MRAHPSVSGRKPRLAGPKRPRGPPRRPSRPGYVVHALACPCSVSPPPGVSDCPTSLSREARGRRKLPGEGGPNFAFLTFSFCLCPLGRLVSLLFNTFRRQIKLLLPEDRRMTRNHGPFEAKERRRTAESSPNEPELFRVSSAVPGLPVRKHPYKKLNVFPGVPRRSQALQPGPPRVKITPANAVGTLGGRAQAPASQTWPRPSKRDKSPVFIIQSKTAGTGALELAPASFIPPGRRNNHHKISYIQILSNYFLIQEFVGAHLGTDPKKPASRLPLLRCAEEREKTAGRCQDAPFGGWRG